LTSCDLDSYISIYILNSQWIIILRRLKTNLAPTLAFRTYFKEVLRRLLSLT